MPTSPSKPRTVISRRHATEAHVRLVVVDMDGTLLDDSGSIPEEFWPIKHALDERSIQFAVASGRQYAALECHFGDRGRGIVFISENGAHVIRDGHEISSSALDPDRVRDIIHTGRQIATRRDLGLVRCGRRSAYIERHDDRFVAEVRRYFADLVFVDDLLDCPEQALKFAVVDFQGTEGPAAQELAAVAQPYIVVPSSMLWMDIMDPRIHKGVGVRALQEELGISPAQTMVFGDYLNDLEMLDLAEYSYAMANAHPLVQARARCLAPSNTDHGVLTILQRVVDHPPEVGG